VGRIEERFTQLKQRGAKAFMPFITAGDPDIDTTVQIIEELARRGADLVELGIPYSDPLADGPTIQASYTRALDKRFSLWKLFDAFKKAASSIGIPVVTMVSYSIVHRVGVATYIDRAVAAGFAGAIIPDLPVEESDEVHEAAKGRDFPIIFLIAPTTPLERQKKIAEASQGFIYYVSVTGITGARDTLPEDVLKNVSALKQMTPKPVCIGFGISKPEQARELAKVGDGVIVGSAIVKIIAEYSSEPAEILVKKVGDFVEPLIRAVKARE